MPAWLYKVRTPPIQWPCRDFPSGATTRVGNTVETLAYRLEDIRARGNVENGVSPNHPQLNRARGALAATAKALAQNEDAKGPLRRARAAFEADYDIDDEARAARAASVQ